MEHGPRKDGRAWRSIVQRLFLALTMAWTMVVLDPLSAQAAGDPTDTSVGAEVSPDGRYVVYFAQPTQAGAVAELRSRHLGDTASVTLYSAESFLSLPSDPFAITPDSQSVIAVPTTPNGGLIGQALYRFAIDGQAAPVRLDTRPGVSGNVRGFRLIPGTADLVFWTDAPALYRADIAGLTPPVLIDSTTLVVWQQFTVTDDGAHGVYVGVPSGNNLPLLYSVALTAASTPMLLSSGLAPDQSIYWSQMPATGPLLSADGTRALFWTVQMWNLPPGTPKYRVYVVDILGVEAPIELSPPVFDAIPVYSSFRWSLDGQALLVTYTANSGAAPGQQGVYLFTLSGTQATRTPIDVGDQPGGDGEFAWTPLHVIYRDYAGAWWAVPVSAPTGPRTSLNLHPQTQLVVSPTQDSFFAGASEYNQPLLWYTLSGGVPVAQIVNRLPVYGPWWVDFAGGRVLYYARVPAMGVYFDEAVLGPGGITHALIPPFVDPDPVSGMWLPPTWAVTAPGWVVTGFEVAHPEYRVHFHSLAEPRPPDPVFVYIPALARP